MVEIASLIVVNLVVAAIIGFIAGYFGWKTKKYKNWFYRES